MVIQPCWLERPSEREDVIPSTSLTWINIQDWKKSPKKGFPYKGIDDPKYIADRKKLFDQNGNGWWWYQGTPLGRLNGD